MRTVFADTLFWVARVRKRDPWRPALLRILRTLGETRIVTTRRSTRGGSSGMGE